MNITKRILSTLLAVTMVLGMFTALLTVQVSADETTTETVSVPIEKYVTQVYNNPQEKLATMQPMRTFGNFQLWVDVKSGEVAYVETDAEGNPTALKNANVKVGVQQDTTGDIYSSDAIKKWGFNDVQEDGTITTDRVVRYKTGAEAVEALKTDKIDMVIIDNEPAKSFVAANEGKIHILEGDNEYAIEDYAICVAKDNTELLEKINQALKELKEDGTIAKIVAKYINAGSSN